MEEEPNPTFSPTTKPFIESLAHEESKNISQKSKRKKLEEEKTSSSVVLGASRSGKLRRSCSVLKQSHSLRNFLKDYEEMKTRNFTDFNRQIIFQIPPRKNYSVILRFAGQEKYLLFQRLKSTGVIHEVSNIYLKIIEVHIELQEYFLIEPPVLEPNLKGLYNLLVAVSLIRFEGLSFIILSEDNILEEKYCKLFRGLEYFFGKKITDSILVFNCNKSMEEEEYTSDFISHIINVPPFITSPAEKEKAENEFNLSLIHNVFNQVESLVPIHRTSITSIIAFHKQQIFQKLHQKMKKKPIKSEMIISSVRFALPTPELPSLQISLPLALGCGITGISYSALPSLITSFSSTTLFASGIGLLYSMARGFNYFSSKFKFHTGIIRAEQLAKIHDPPFEGFDFTFDSIKIIPMTSKLSWNSLTSSFEAVKVNIINENKDALVTLKYWIDKYSFHLCLKDNPYCEFLIKYHLSYTQPPSHSSPEDLREIEQEYFSNLIPSGFQVQIKLNIQIQKIIK